MDSVTIMTSLIHEIQLSAAEGSRAIASLLRKVRLAAGKLHLEEIEQWVLDELNGYEDRNVPPYRIVRGTPRAWNPYHGWVPIVMQDVEAARLLSKRPILQPVEALESLLDSEWLSIPYSPRTIEYLNRAMDVQLGEMALHVGKGQIVGILNAVRNQILEWSIAMEKAGVVGEGMTFTGREKEMAKETTTTINIGTIGAFAGNLGSHQVSGSIEQRLPEACVKDLLNKIRLHEEDLVLAGVERERLRVKLREIEDAVTSNGTRPDSIWKLLLDVRAIVQNAAGSVVGAGVLALIQAAISS